MPRPNPITLYNSPISASESSLCTVFAAGKKTGGLQRIKFSQRVGDAAIDQKARLRGIAKQFRTCCQRRVRNAGKINVRGDVLQPWSEKGIGMRVMPVMAHQRPLAALRMVVLAPRKTIVQQQCRAARKHCADGSRPCARGLMEFSQIIMVAVNGIQ